MIRRLMLAVLPHGMVDVNPRAVHSVESNVH
jgi:hypothetical protein